MSDTEWEAGAVDKRGSSTCSSGLCDVVPTPMDELPWQLLFHEAEAFLQQGRVLEAEERLVIVLRKQEQTEGRNALVSASVLNNLAHVARLQGDLASAELMLNRVILIQESHGGEGTLELAESLAHRAMLLRERGVVERAEADSTRALRILEATEDRDSPAMASALNLVAMLALDLGDRELADTSLHRAIRILEEALGYDHPDVVPTMRNHGMLYMQMGDYDSAIKLFKRGIEILDSSYGSGLAEKAPLYHSLASALEQQGDAAAAADCLREVLKGKEAASRDPEKDLELVPIMISLAHNLANAKDFKAAARMRMRALGIQKANFGWNTVEVAENLLGLAIDLSRLRKYRSAEKRMSVAYKIMRSKLGKDHERVQKVGHALLRMRRELKKAQEQKDAQDQGGADPDLDSVPSDGV